jgi:predicted transcriptional regulator
MPRSTRPALTNLEQLIMDVLWKSGSATSEEVREALTKRHPMKQSTTRTILVRLEEKGYVTHRVNGRTFVYSAAEPPANLAAKAIRHIIDRFCGGSVERLMVGMVDNEIVSHADLEKLARKIKQRKAKEG